MERFMRERVRRPACSEFLEAAVTPLDAREVDAVEMTERLAGLRGEIRVVRRAPRLVELHASRFASHIDQAREQGRAAHRDSTAGEVARDRAELVLLSHAFLMAREAKRGEAAGDNEEYSYDPHPQRIGMGPDGLEEERT